MKKPFKLAFCGRSGSGKDTAADYLSRHFTFRRYALADPVKAAVFAAFPCFDFSKYGKNEPIPELDGRSQRELFQTMGTEWGRNMVHPDMWIDGLIRRIRHAEEKNPNYRPSIIVTDVRRENEAQRLADEGFYIVKIVRPDTFLPGAAGNHVSEYAVDDVFCHEVLLNDGTIAEFHAKVLGIAEKTDYRGAQ
jgi:hypothetical protein